MATEEKQLPAREYGKIVLTLNNVLVPEEKLSPTPSVLDGLDAETEMDLRILGCEVIQMSGILLKLPQTAMATGQVLFQRFYYSKSFVKHTMEVIAMACVNLASKIEEAPRRIRDVVNVFHHIKQVRSGKNITPLMLNQDYINLKNQVIKGERRVLKELGFCVHVKHPHKIIVMYLQVLEAERNQALVQMACNQGCVIRLSKIGSATLSWNYMNDSFRTTVFMRFHPETIAVACIYLAARRVGVSLPNNPPWYEVFGHATQEVLQTIALQILSLYKRQKPSADKLDEAVERAKKLHVEAKKRAKGDHTPNSRQVSPANMDSPLTAAKKLRNENEHNSDGSFGARHRTRSPRSRSRTPHSITNSRSYNSGGGSSRSRSRSPKHHHRGRRHHSRHRHRDRGGASPSSKKNSSSKSSSSKSRRGGDDRGVAASANNDKYKDKYASSRDRYDYGDKYYKKSSSSAKRRSVSFSPSPTRRSYSSSPERSRHKKKAVRHSRHRDRSRSRERHRR